MRIRWKNAEMAALLCGCAAASLLANAAPAQSKPGKCPPEAHRGDVVDNLHGSSIPDPYRWLEDQNSPETRAWIDAEDACTAAVLNAVPGRAAIAKRLSELLKVDTFVLPTIRPGVYFFAKRGADQDLFVIYKRQGLNAADQVLVDPHGLSADHSTSVGLAGVSRDGSLAAYRVRAGGQDEVTMHFIDTV